MVSHFKTQNLSENIYIPNITANVKYVENIVRVTDIKISLSPRLKVSLFTSITA